MQNQHLNTVLSFLTMLFMFYTSQVYAEVINVPDDFETIQAAIDDDDTEDGDTVLVAPGNYPEHIDFSGKNIVVGSRYLTTGDWQFVIETIIEPEERGSVVTFTNGKTEDAEITGFTLTGGGADVGGGIYCQDADPRIIGCIISDNIGNGIYCRDASPQIIGCIISDNNAAGGGGICIHGEVNPVITDCEILSNIAGFAGGGVFIGEGANVELTRCSFYNNSAWDSEAPPGHAISMGRSVATLTNCTIGSQSIEFWNSYNAIALIGSRIEIVNCIIWSDWGTSIALRYELASQLTISYTDIEGGIDAISAYDDDEVNWGEGNINEVPLFVDADNGDFHLTEDSPCIDAGDPDSPHDPDLTHTDMGAYYSHQDFHFEVSADSLHFDEVLLDSSAELTLTITNLGDTELEIDTIDINNEAFTHSFDADTVVQPEGEYELTVTFTPDSVSEYAASLEIITNDPVNREITISLSGSCVEPGAVSENKSDLPTEFYISGIHPNPFNSTTTIIYNLPVTSPVSLRLFDLSGRNIRTLLDGYRQAGMHRSILTAQDLPSGLYFVRMKASNQVFTQKVMLIR
ncbi:MAG: right-handed parallel beta-helix repeat-containing protein [Calditrichaeota bacterium]|nr:right-handed parallel beta-helix repeat-containing protein [Calditrichota bacterium]